MLYEGDKGLLLSTTMYEERKIVYFHAEDSTFKAIKMFKLYELPGVLNHWPTFGALLQNSSLIILESFC